MTAQHDGYVIPRLGWGARLRAIREDVAHMDQREFAESIGMNHGTYGGHEKRVEVPRGSRLIANSIELRWHVPARWVLTGEEPGHGTEPDGEVVTCRLLLADVRPIRPDLWGIAGVGMPAARAG